MIEQMPCIPSFITPDIKGELGEIRRVAEEVAGADNLEKINNFNIRFFEAAQTATLVELSENIWGQLENTDSYDILPNDWSSVEEHAVVGHPEKPRDWQFFKTRYEQNGSIEAPMVLKKDGQFHLVSGNTRLMVARALGIIPKVLLIELDE